MKDMLGNEIKVGDTVAIAAYSCGAFIRVGQVYEICSIDRWCRYSKEASHKDYLRIDVSKSGKNTKTYWRHNIRVEMPERKVVVISGSPVGLQPA